ncbi:MAG: TIM barrel protein [Nanoarchaeota archaeon]|nr:TIM barrel protein [Nanoarchaeota archaeon]
MVKIKFGPAGLGPVKDAIKNLEYFHSLGFEACEIAFTYGAYIKDKKEAEEIGKKAKELGIQLSIHAPYFVNLGTEDEKKLENTKKRIIKCLEVGTWLGVKYIVFHPGYYVKKGKEVDKKETYERIKKGILELQEIRRENNYTPKLAPETMGKVNVFGSIEEVAQLVRDTKCHACIDFAHILARSGGDYRFEETLRFFDNLEELHIHFSGIEYGDKGEKNHKKTLAKELKELLENLPKNKNVVVINESPEMIDDSSNALELYKNLKR